MSLKPWLFMSGILTSELRSSLIKLITFIVPHAITCSDLTTRLLRSWKAIYGSNLIIHDSGNG